MAECFWTDLVGCEQEVCGAINLSDLRAIAFIDENRGATSRPMALVYYNNGNMPYPPADNIALTYARVVEAHYYRYDDSCFITGGPYGFNGLEPNFDNLVGSVFPPVVTTGLSIYLVDEYGTWVLMGTDYTPQYGATKFTVETSLGTLDWWVIYDNCF